MHGANFISVVINGQPIKGIPSIYRNEKWMAFRAIGLFTDFDTDVGGNPGGDGIIIFVGLVAPPTTQVH